MNIGISDGQEWNWSCPSCSFRNDATSHQCSKCSTCSHKKSHSRSNEQQQCVDEYIQISSDKSSRGPLHHTNYNLSQVSFVNPYKRSAAVAAYHNPYASSSSTRAKSAELSAARKLYSQPQQEPLLPRTSNDEESKKQIEKEKNPQKQVVKLKQITIPSDPFSHTQSKLVAAQATRERIRYAPGPVLLDKNTCIDWIYPTNYPVRDYQLEITKRALFENTLVSLPTGLGKTLIAAVVMFNYYRWFPDGGKVVFCAPTRPLVSQQIKACYDIMGIPAKHTAEISGKIEASTRKSLWSNHRLFFCTPQTLEHDIDNESCDASKIVCIVLDETHKARGDYAYCKVIEEIEKRGARFRVLGLSATPGTNIAAIQEVIENLRIGEICVRLETDDDVKKYIHEKQTEVIVVKQSSAVTLIERLMSQLIQPLIDNLRGVNALFTHGTASTLHPYMILKAKERYHESRNDRQMDGVFGAAHKLLTIKQHLRTHGVGVAKQALFDVKRSQNGLIRSIIKRKEFQDVLDAVEEATTGGKDSKVQAKLQLLKDDKEGALNLKMNNPKLEKLCEILVEHFENERKNGKSTRVIVFSQWRKSVDEIVCVLKTEESLRPRKFVGQGKGSSSGKDGKSRGNETGMKQREQEEAIRQFTDGKFNVLVCTSIGEEGLDIGQVDLIVSFDCVASATRMIQRNGRTGRKRDGKVVLLVSEGSEEQKHKKSQTASKTLNAALKNPSSFVMKKSPVLFPPDCFPTLKKKNIAISQEYRISQIGGYRHQKLRKKIRQNNLPSDSNEWKLCPGDEEERRIKYGVNDLNLFESDLNVVNYVSNGDCYRAVFPRSLRRKYLKSMKLSRISVRDSSMGHTSTILRSVQLLNMETEAAEDKQIKKSSPLIKCTSLSQGIVAVDELYNFDDVQCFGEDSLLNESSYIVNDSAMKSNSAIINVDDRCDFDEEATHSNSDLTQESGTDTLNQIFGSCSIIPLMKSHVVPIRLFDSIQSRDLSRVEPPPDKIVSPAPIPFPDTILDDLEICHQGATRKDHVDHFSTLPNESIHKVLQRKFHKERLEPCGSDPNLSLIPINNTLLDKRLDKNKSRRCMTSDDSNILMNDTDIKYLGVLKSNKDSAKWRTKNTDVDSNLPSDKFDHKEDTPDHLEKAVVDETLFKEFPPPDSKNGVVNDRKQTGFILPTQDSSSDSEDDDEVTNCHLFRFDSKTLSLKTHSIDDVTKANTTAASNDHDIDREIRHALDCVFSEYFENSIDIRNIDVIEIKEKIADILSYDVKNLTQDHESLIQEKLNELIGPTETTIGDVQKQTYEKLNSKTQNSPSTTLFGTISAQVERGPMKTNSEAIHVSSLKNQHDKDKSPDLFDSYEQDFPIKAYRRKKRKHKGNVLLTPSPGFCENLSTSVFEKRNCDDDEDVSCSICLDVHSTTSDPIVFCDGDGCSVAVHMSCYNVRVPLKDDIPWYCEPCELRKSQGQNSSKLSMVCGICNQTNGALKRTDPPEMLWAHQVCCWWTPEFQEKDGKLGTLENLKRKEPERGSLRCTICNLKGGAVQCSISRCFRAAHPHCAMNAPRSTQWILISDCSTTSLTWSMFCDLHLDKATTLIEKERISSEEIFGVKLCSTNENKNKTQDQLCDDSDDENFTNNCRSFHRLKMKKFIQKDRDSGSQKENKSQLREISRISRSKRRRRAEASLIETEAHINSDEDVDGDFEESEMLRMIEDEEVANSSFINDSSQLGSFRDSLDQVNESFQTCTTNEDGNDLHRKIDNERERATEFSTPVLNRRVLQKDMGTFSDMSCATTPRSSLKGLGNMHFIHSVLDHHRQGGNADDLEIEYNNIVAQGEDYTQNDKGTSQNNAEREGHALNDNGTIQHIAKKSAKSPETSVHVKVGDNEIIDMTIDSKADSHTINYLKTSLSIPKSSTGNTLPSSADKPLKFNLKSKIATTALIYNEVSAQTDGFALEPVHQMNVQPINHKPNSRSFQSNRSWNDISEKHSNCSQGHLTMKTKTGNSGYVSIKSNIRHGSIGFNQEMQPVPPAGQLNQQQKSFKWGEIIATSSNRDHSTTSINKTVTAEMRARAEVNRKRALEIREQKRKKALEASSVNLVR